MMLNRSEFSKAIQSSETSHSMFLCHPELFKQCRLIIRCFSNKTVHLLWSYQTKHLNHLEIFKKSLNRPTFSQKQFCHPKLFKNSLNRLKLFTLPLNHPNFFNQNQSFIHSMLFLKNDSFMQSFSRKTFNHPDLLKQNLSFILCFQSKSFIRLELAKQSISITLSSSNKVIRSFWLR